MDLPPPPQSDDPIITQFQPVGDDQWELNEDNIKRIDTKTGSTILHNYCQYINATPLGVYRYLIETKGCDVNAQEYDKHVPIHYAIRYCEGDNIAVLMYLLTQCNVDTDAKDGRGYTLLHMACQNINSLPIDVFKLLIETKGCNINAQAEKKDTPLHLATCRFCPTEDGGDNITTLTYLLNQENVNVNIKGERGHTLLHEACFNINRFPLDLFKVLIETKGGDLNIHDNDKYTPTHHALHYFNDGDIAVLNYLLNQKDVNVNGRYGSTLLHSACINIDTLPLDVFKILIETQGCDVNALDNHQNTPIHLALDNFNPHEGGDITVLTYLINQKGVNLNITNRNDHTLLHLACICEIEYYDDADYDSTNSDDDLDNSDDSVEAKSETSLCQVVEVIVETCLEQILDGTRF
jgi:ankyrin repeat protein